MKKFFFLLLWLPTLLNAQSGHVIPNPLKNIPKWARDVFSAQHLDEKYTIIYSRFPQLLSGDFNGDGRKDVVLQIQESSSGKDGIAIVHQHKAQALATFVAIIGAGRSFEHSLSDLKELPIWSRIPRNKIQSEPIHPPLATIKGDVIRLQTKEGKSTFIYWNGKQYTWYNSKK